MKKLLKNPWLYLALVVLALFALPPLYLKTTNVGILADLYLRFKKVESPAITPDMVQGYRPPPREQFSAEDYIRFKLELLNAVNHAVEGKEEFMEELIYLRYNITRKDIKKFRAMPKSRIQIQRALEKMPKWRKKIQLALKEAKKKGTKHPFVGDPL